MNRVSAWCLPIVLMAGGGASAQPSPPAPRAAAAAADDTGLVEIAAFRHLMGHDDSTGAARKFAVILCVEGAPPPQSVLDAIGRSHPHVLPCGVPSRMIHGELRVEGDPGKPAIRYGITRIEIHGDDATLEAGYFEANQSAARYSFTLHRDHGTWRVVASTTDMIA